MDPLREKEHINNELEMIHDIIEVYRYSRQLRLFCDQNGNWKDWLSHPGSVFRTTFWKWFGKYPSVYFNETTECSNMTVSQP